MEKTLDELENATVISNPKEPGRTLLRKLAYRAAYWKDRIKRLVSPGSKQKPSP
jgi:hypothetical protein